MVERNIVRAIVFVGNDNYKSGQLINKLNFKLGDFLDILQARGGSEILIDFYKSKGYPQVDITVDPDKLSEGRVIYNIKEGPRVKINSVHYAGNESLKTSELKKVVKTSKKKLVVLTRYYVEQEIEKDIQKLQSIYFERGFLDVKIAPQLNYNEDKTKVDLVFNITEGASYVVNTIDVTGNTLIDANEMKENMQLQTSAVYNDRQANADIKFLEKRFKEQGFVEAKIEKKRKFIGDDKVDVEYAIMPGGKFRIGKINIIGNKETQDKVVRRVLDEYDFKPGQWYNSDIAKGDGEGYLEKMIRRMAVMESAVITPTGDDPNTRDAQVNVTEGQTGMVMLGAGIGSDDGVVGQLVFTQRNFDFRDKPKSLSELFTGQAYKGAGQTLRIALEPGTEFSRYSIQFTEPYFRDKPIQMDLAGSSYTRERESYDEDRLKGFIGFEKRYKNKWRRSVAVRVENVDITDLENDAPLEVIADKGKHSLFGLRLGIGKDMRDDQYNPSKGYSFNGGYEQVAGDDTFGILDAVYRYYKTLDEDLAENKTVLAIKVLGATTVGDAPVFEKFYAGGTGTYGIRGFDYRGVSPRGTTPTGPSGDPIGSDWIGIANAEVTIPLGNEVFSALLFVDSGIVEDGGYRASAGTGLQILMPQWFGPVPMRFELAAPLMKDESDDTRPFSFSVGRLF